MRQETLHRLAWIPQLAAVAIMGQTLFFKFTAHPESVQLFAELGAEPAGRLLVGALELLACVLLLAPAFAAYGALIGAALMIGALLSHVAILGWEGDRLTLGLLAATTLLACLAILFLRRNQLSLLPKRRRSDQT